MTAKNTLVTQKNHCTFSGFFKSAFCWKDVVCFILLCAALQPFKDTLVLTIPDYTFHSLITSHWVHVNWTHWALNMGVLFSLPILFPNIARWAFWVQSVFSAIFISWLLIHCNQLVQLNVTSYAGFSGVLHGVYWLFAMLFITKHLLQKYKYKISTSNIQQTKGTKGYFFWQAVFISIIIPFKIMFEQMYQPQQTAVVIKAQVVYAAHLDGWLFAVLMYVVFIATVFVFFKSGKKHL